MNKEYPLLPIPGWEDLYATQGDQIISLRSGKSMKQKLSGRNILYYCVGLRRRGFKQKNVSVHSMILSANLGRPIADGMKVDHIDGNGLNNSVDNLRVVPVAINSRNVRLPKDKAEKTEVFGVSKVYQKQKGKIYEYFRANYKGQNGVYQKQFSIEKLGEEMAFFLALCWRVHWIQEDGTFTEGHGNAR